jgi:hypothetical protein
MPPTPHTLGPLADVELMLTPRGELVETRLIQIVDEPLELAEFNRRALARRQERAERARRAERRHHVRELVEAALLAAVLLLAVYIVGLWLFSTPIASASERRGGLVGYRAELRQAPTPAERRAARSPEALVARALPAARELAPAAPADVRVVLVTAEELVEEANARGAGWALGEKAGGYFPAERVVLLDRARLRTLERTVTLLAHELGHAALTDAGVPADDQHVDDPAALMYGGPLTPPREALRFARRESRLQGFAL